VLILFRPRNDANYQSSVGADLFLSDFSNSDAKSIFGGPAGADWVGAAEPSDAVRLFFNLAAANWSARLPPPEPPDGGGGGPGGGGGGSPEPEGAAAGGRGGGGGRPNAEVVSIGGAGGGGGAKPFLFGFIDRIGGGGGYCCGVGVTGPEGLFPSPPAKTCFKICMVIASILVSLSLMSSFSLLFSCLIPSSMRARETVSTKDVFETVPMWLRLLEPCLLMEPLRWTTGWKAPTRERGFPPAAAVTSSSEA
jgi:hypothetical protein